MTAKKKTDAPKIIREKIILTAIDMAAQKGWDKVTLASLARKVKIPLADLRDLFEDKMDIWAGFERMIDRQVLAQASDDGSSRDRMFDLMMSRYEALNEYRGGVISMIESFRKDPKLAIIGMPYLCRSMSWVLEAAGDNAAGMKGAIKVAGLTGIYLKVLNIWMKDESSDLAKTMAALDRDLGRAEGLLERFKLHD